MGRNH